MKLDYSEYMFSVANDPHQMQLLKIHTIRLSVHIHVKYTEGCTPLSSCRTIQPTMKWVKILATCGGCSYRQLYV